METLGLGMTVSMDEPSAESVEVEREPRCRFSRESEFLTTVPWKFSEGLELVSGSTSVLKFANGSRFSRSMVSDSRTLPLGGVCSAWGLERSGLASLPLKLIFSD
jgi:hypothetical protein